MRASRILDEIEQDTALPDGMHLSAVGHEAVADRLAAEVGTWLAGRGATVADASGRRGA